MLLLNLRSLKKNWLKYRDFRSLSFSHTHTHTSETVWDHSPLGGTTVQIKFYWKSWQSSFSTDVFYWNSTIYQTMITSVHKSNCSRNMWMRAFKNSSNTKTIHRKRSHSHSHSIVCMLKPLVIIRFCWLQWKGSTVSMIKSSLYTKPTT